MCLACKVLVIFLILNLAVMAFAILRSNGEHPL
jgi:hypothetical protein